MLDDNMIIQSNLYTYAIKDDDNTYLVNFVHTAYSKINNDFYLIFKDIEKGITLKELHSKYALPDNINALMEDLLHAGLIEVRNHGKKPIINARKSYNNHLAIFPTHACNLNCIYCYADAGRNSKQIDKEIIDITMDYFFSTHIDSAATDASLDFHGGGEPTVAFELLKYATEIFLEGCIKSDLTPRLGMATNAYFSDEIADWIIEKKFNLTVSFDVLEDVQNNNRPNKLGENSYNKVYKNLCRIIESKIKYEVRATITQKNVHRLPDMLDEAHKLGLTSLHVEPALEVGRCIKTKTNTPITIEFSKYFLEAFRKSINYNIHLTYSGLKLMGFPRARFCGACGDNFAITPEGFISSCYEVVHTDDPAANEFIYGQVSIQDGVQVDNEKLYKLLNRTVEDIKQCEGCFLQWYCAGDCPIRGYRATGSLFEVNGERCKMHRRITKKVINMLIEEKYNIGRDTYLMNYEWSK